MLLDHARHRPCTHFLVVTLRNQPVARRVIDLDAHLALAHLGFEFGKELVDHGAHYFRAERAELDDAVEAIAEFRREHFLHCLESVTALILLGKADRATAHLFGAGIRRHDQHRVAKVRLASVVVGERSMIHHLQQQVEHLRMCLLDLIEQQYTMRMLGHGIGQQAALIETHIAGRRPDQARDSVALHVFRHVEADQLETERFRQLAAGFGLADTGRTREQEAGYRLLAHLEPGTRELDGSRQRIHGRSLTKHHLL